MNPKLPALALCAFLVGTFTARAAERTNALHVGVDANYSLAMEKDGQKWRWSGQEQELLKGMAERGVKRFRVRLWTGDDGTNGKNYATEIVKRTTAAGLDPYLVIFLSEDWADMVKQPAPTIWKDLDLEARAKAVQKYSQDIVAHFRAAGLRSHLYEIGNEIDYGICGVYPGKSTKKNPETLSRKCWPDAAKLIRASQAGVLAADPQAKFLLHIAHWWDVGFCTSFFQFMTNHGVQLDYAGLSYFPTANIGGSLELEQFGAVVTQLHAAIKRPISIPETAYPSTKDFKGQFSRWKKETPGYPLTPEGQRRWLQDFLAFCEQHPAIDSVYYWSPEWYGEGMWKAFALFDPDGEAKPAWGAFTNRSTSRLAPKAPLHFEAVSNRIVAVPTEEAKQKSAIALREELQIYGGVTTSYIRAITSRVLVVGAYRVNLRASLSGNVDLNLVEAPPKPDWKADLEKADAAKQKIILFIRSGAEMTAAEFQRYAERKNFVVLPHPLAADKPLKFGFGQRWQEDLE
jgi:arabinogalactan endo-1,4-beta-galactosidase